MFGIKQRCRLYRVTAVPKYDKYDVLLYPCTTQKKLPRMYFEPSASVTRRAKDTINALCGKPRQRCISYHRSGWALAGSVSSGSAIVKISQYTALQHTCRGWSPSSTREISRRKSRKNACTRAAMMWRSYEVRKKGMSSLFHFFSRPSSFSSFFRDSFGGFTIMLACFWDVRKINIYWRIY